MGARRHEPDDDYRALVREAVHDARTFQRLTFSQPSPRRGKSPRWKKVSVRPVLVKERRMLQFEYFGQSKAITKNYAGERADRKLDRLLRMPFTQVHLQSRAGDVHVRITRKGKPLVSRGKPSMPDREPDLAHDRRKEHLLASGEPDEFLQALGVMGEDGEVLPTMQGKFRQMNEFLRVVDQTVVGQDWLSPPLRIVDCGCGKAYLTFAACHYLNDIQGIPTQVAGVDANAELIGEVRALAEPLQWEGLEFHVSAIKDFTPEWEPDVMLSLHACDTATDEALARGIQWGSRVILAAPCCQHELHEQLQAPLFTPVQRHGILRERLADILTDAFRALALRIMGYRASVIEFVDPEATAKNLMIRAEGGLPEGDGAFVREYRTLKQFWKVTPAIEELLGERFRTIVGSRE
jgi:SAM-dependent methyltransferase